MKVTNRWWVVVASVFGLLVGNGPIMQFTFGIFLLPLTREFGWGRSTTSMALVIGLVMTGLCVPFAGRLIDRYGIRRVTLPSITLFSLCLAALAVLPVTPAMFIGLYALMGVAAAGQTPLPYAKAISSWFDDRRGLALGIAMSGVGLGAALIPQFAQHLVAVSGWKGAYLGLAAIVLLLGFPAVALGVRESGASMSHDQKAALPGLTAREAFRTDIFWKLTIAFFAVALATNGAIAHVVPLLVDHGITPRIAASAMAFAGIALTVGRFIAGYLLDRIYAPYVAAIFVAMPLAGVGLLLGSSTPQSASVAIVLVGMGVGAEVDLIAFLLSRYIGMRSFGEIYGYMFAVFMLGSGIGPYLMGLAFDKTGSYSIALVGLCAVLAVACVLLLRLGRYRYPLAGGNAGKASASHSLAH